MEGKEGDWECIGCRNRNYAFRSLCNRCKQARVFVDLKTPHNSKWLPRIGDWICTGCTNNNYASREKCKKCGQAKELSSMPAVAYGGGGHHQAYYISDVTGGGEMKINLPSSHNAALHYAPPLFNPSLSAAAAAAAGMGSYRFPLAIHHAQSLQASSVLNGWRNGDWICNCGFHNYASREQCKQCNSSLPQALGAKRSASEELLHVSENKRLNLGNQQVYQACQSLKQAQGATSNIVPAAYALLSSIGSGTASNSQASVSVPLQMPMNALLGKGATYWRNGDWMCANCKNHNYASRTSCNRCKAERDATAPPICSPLNGVCC